MDAGDGTDVLVCVGNSVKLGEGEMIVVVGEGIGLRSSCFSNPHRTKSIEIPEIPINLRKSLRRSDSFFACDFILFHFLLQEPDGA